MRTTLLLVLSLCMLAKTADAMKITGDAQGNIIPAGKTLTLTVSDAKGQVRYDVVDYFGSKVTSGTGATVKLSGLTPGWYELRCTDDAGTAAATIGVVIDRGNAPLPEDGRIAVDTIGCGHGVAGSVRRGGFSWIRDRLWWSVVQWNSGPIDWKDYPAYADAHSAAGLRVTQVWHDSPPWLHPKNPNTGVPDDLRDIYQFSKIAAAKFAGKWHSWEMGNEPDLGWMGDRFAGYEKAASLGLKDGNPNAIISPASIGFGLSPFVKQIYECGLADYCDILNWHFYGKSDQIAWNLDAYLSVLRLYGADGRPVWITEGGVPMPAEAGPNKRDLTMESQRVITTTVPRNVVMALAAGNDRYFYFSFSSHYERGLEFGLLRPDLTPYPQFVAYSASANVLGVSDYLGEFATGDASAKAYVFSTPRGNVLAIWSDKAVELAIPTENASVRLANIFGAESELKAQGGVVRVKTGPEITYVINVGKSIQGKLSGTPRPRGKFPKNKPSQVVVMGYPELGTNSELSRYEFADPRKPAPFDFTVEVYNFNAKEKKAGAVDLAIPADWSVDKKTADVTLEPMGRAVLTFKVTPTVPKTVETLNAKIIVTGRFGVEKVSPSVSYIGFDSGVLPIVSSKPIEWASAPAWQTEVSGCGNDNAVTNAITIKQVNPKTIDVQCGEKTIEVGSTDVFSYAVQKFKTPVDLSAYDGIAVTVKGGPKEGSIRLMLVEPSGVMYYHTVPCTPGQSKRVVMAFRDFRWAIWFTSDPNYQFDLNEIAGVKVGRECSNLSFEIGDFELVKFPHAK